MPDSQPQTLGGMRGGRGTTHRRSDARRYLSETRLDCLRTGVASPSHLKYNAISAFTRGKERLGTVLIPAKVDMPNSNLIIHKKNQPFYIELSINKTNIHWERKWTELWMNNKQFNKQKKVIPLP